MAFVGLAPQGMGASFDGALLKKTCRKHQLDWKVQQFSSKPITQMSVSPTAWILWAFGKLAVDFPVVNWMVH